MKNIKRKKTCMKKIPEISPAVRSGIPRIELSGNLEAVIDGCFGILEYNAEKIVLDSGKYALSFFGSSLYLKFLTGSDAIIAGKINSIEFADKKGD